jgi:hypothetical protein
MGNFAIDIYNKMNGNSSINSLVSGIYFENLPDDSDLTKNWIVYTFNQINSISTLSIKNQLSEYNLQTNVLSPNNNTLNNIANQLNTYLLSVIDTSVRDIYLKDDQHSKDQEQGIYVNTLNYYVIYQNF